MAEVYRPAGPEGSSRSPSASLVAERLSCRFGTRTVLDDVSLAAPAGTVTVLVGPSGCGKTTLLRIIAGVERPSAGRVLLDGEVVSGPEVFVRPEDRRIGLVFQDGALFPHLSVMDNVRFGLLGRPRATRNAAAAAALDAVGLSHLSESRPGQLSGGEGQRVALARALAAAPRVLLMDEPFSHLDRSLRDGIRDATLALLRETGITTVVVTHDPEEALAIADHLVLLAAGRVLQAGSPDDLYRRPASVAAAQALSDLNEIPGRFRAGRLETPLGSFPAEGPGVEGAAGLLCVRPEDVGIGPGGGGGTPGRVEGRTFRGATVALAVSVEGVARPLRAVVATATGPAPGDRVGVVVDAARGMVFLDA